MHAPNIGQIQFELRQCLTLNISFGSSRNALIFHEYLMQVCLTKCNGRMVFRWNSLWTNKYCVSLHFTFALFPFSCFIVLYVGCGVSISKWYFVLSLHKHSETTLLMQSINLESNEISFCGTYDVIASAWLFYQCVVVVFVCFKYGMLSVLELDWLGMQTNEIHINTLADHKWLYSTYTQSPTVAISWVLLVTHL